MTPAQAITAGALAMTRKNLRSLALSKGPARLTMRTPQGDVTIHLDAPATRAVFEAADLEMSDRLLKLGVSEHENIAIAAPEAGSSAPPRPVLRPRKPRPDGLQQPLEDA